MAKKIADREDLLRDGVQMKVRGRTYIEGHEVFVGFRSEGQVSLYWDQDPVFQFNSDYELRRVFYSGQRFAAYNGELVCLTSTADSPESSVLRLELQRTSAAHVKDDIVACFERIRSQLLTTSDITWQCVGVDSSNSFVELVASFLSSIATPPAIAQVPNA